MFQLGDTVGDYEIVGFLGRGGMGQVYKVRNRILDRVEAMKVLLPGREDDPQIGQRFEREVRVQANLHHPNIAALHTALWVEGQLLMIIEFVDGVTLAEKLRKGPLSIPEGVNCICRVLDALAYAHAEGVIHRDVKPGNIMITAAGAVKLTDFGIARSFNETITRSGIAVGSLHYMSPEQIKTGMVDGRSDIYSVGVTLYEALMGKRPIQGDSEHAIISGHLEQIPVPPADFTPGFPAPLSRIIMKSLAKSPAERFQSAGEFRTVLESLGDLGSGSSAARTLVAATIDPATLARIEKCLAAAMGPIARPLVARTARGVEDAATLRRLLADQIPAESARQSFLRCCERQTGDTTIPGTHLRTASTGHTAANAPTREYSPEFLEKVQRELARYIGPFARVIVNKTAKTARTPQQLIEILGNEIPGAKEREEFVSRCLLLLQHF
jgi:eukaryotic-like serine/threonine-protein kinase